MMEEMLPLYTYEAEVKRVVDGDTIDLLVDLGFTVHVKVRVRLLGIDTPEVYGVKHGTPEHTAGLAASNRVKEILPVGEKVRVRTEKGTGKYGRWLASVYYHGPQGFVCLNDQLLTEGLAKPYDS